MPSGKIEGMAEKDASRGLISGALYGNVFNWDYGMNNTHHNSTAV